MVSDPSALLLLKCGIPCHKSSEKLHLQNNLGHKLVHGAGGGGSAHAHSAQIVNVYVLLCIPFNLQFNSSF